MADSPLMTRFREGQQLSRQHRYAEAEQAFRDCLEMRPRDIPARNQLAMTLLRMGRADEAEAELGRSMRQDPDNLPTLSQLATLYERQNRLKEAEALYRRCLELNPEDGPSTLRLTRLLMDREDYTEAEALLKRILPRRLARADVPAACQLGVVYARQGRLKEAEGQFAACLEADSENIPARHQLGMLYARQDMPQKAERLFQECIRLDGSQYQAYHQLGMLYTRQERYPEAERMLNACIRIDAKQPAAYQHLGVLYAKQGRRADAERMFEQCMQRGASPEAAQSLAVFRAEQGDGDTARRLLSKMAAGETRNKARLMCATALEKAGKRKEAIRFLEEILSEEPGSIPALHLKGSLLMTGGDHAGAKKCFEGILRQDETNTAALHSLAELLIEQGSTEEGIALLERIAETDGSSYLNEKLGWIKGESYDPALVWREINRHMKDDTNRPLHSVFHMNAMEINQAIAQCMAAGQYESRGMTRRYTYPWPNAGHEGGRNGDGHIHHGLAVITYWDGERIINAYPCDLPEGAA